MNTINNSRVQLYREQAQRNMEQVISTFENSVRDMKICLDNFKNSAPTNTPDLFPLNHAIQILLNAGTNNDSIMKLSQNIVDLSNLAGFNEGYNEALIDDNIGKQGE